MVAYEVVGPDAPSPRGLSAGEAAQRLVAHGPNALAEARRAPAWLGLLAQFRSPLVVLLLGACALSVALAEVADAVAIGAILVINAVIGFVQEHRAERAIAALRGMTAPRARVLRDGRALVVAAADVVPGDLLLLEAGDLVAADARVVSAHRLSTSEAALTGESEPVAKSAERAPPDAPLAERHDHVFMGTAVATGTGLAEVVATGMDTEIGRVVDLMRTTEDRATPLQERLARVGRTLLWMCLAVVAVVAALGLARGLDPLEVLLVAASLAVAAVPEGLPAVVTIALALGVRRMAADNALVRKLSAVETLGCATVICTDKTGTLTTGVMSLRERWGDDDARLLDAAAACCDATLADDAGAAPVGDPTEVAILAAAAEHGITRDAIERERPRREVQPFDPERKRMSIARADGVLYVKGAVESVLACARAGTAHDAISAAAADLGAHGLRVLAVAVGRGRDEAELEVLGLLGIADPPRPAAVAAIAAARRAGVRTVMITGDHATTAHAIAREMGILAAGDDPAELVYARATPEDKLTIVRDLERRGEIVAMTGDGVNDAPALREAHIGIAMGRTGTEVTREASDMVLADDDFATIVTAIREGRAIFDNIRKTLVYLLSGNVAELVLMLLAGLAGWPVPLLPLQLLWVNLVTDGLPALVLAIDPVRGDTLDRPPRSPAEPILGRREWTVIGLVGALEALCITIVFGWALATRGVDVARDMAFTTLILSEILRAVAARSATRIYWQVGPLTNLRLVAVIAASAALLLVMHELDATRELFHLVALTPFEVLVTVLVALVPVSALEVGKLVRARRSARRG